MRLNRIIFPPSSLHRVEYDAYRSDLEFYATAPKTEVNQNNQRDTQQKFDAQKEEFEKLRSDVQIKLKFLDKNRVRKGDRLEKRMYRVGRYLIDYLALTLNLGAPLC